MKNAEKIRCGAKAAWCLFVTAGILFIVFGACCMGMITSGTMDVSLTGAITMIIVGALFVVLSDIVKPIIEGYAQVVEKTGSD